MKDKIKQLADIIEKNPNCQFIIDNDCWDIVLPKPDGDEETPIIANSADFEYDSDWYGHSSNYGFALSEALIELLNRRGFNISAAAV